MKQVELKYAEKIGGWYGFVASALAILLFLLIVAVIGVVFMNYHPFQLIKDLLYIYNYGFILGCGLALILSYIVGKSTGRSIANKKASFANKGILTGLAIFFLCVLVGLIILFLQTHEAGTPIDIEFKLRNWGMTFLFIFILGFIPVIIIGYLYGWIVKRQVTLASHNRAEN